MAGTRTPTPWPRTPTLRRQGLLGSTPRHRNGGQKENTDLILADLAHGLLTQTGLALRLGRHDEAVVAADLARRLVLRAAALPDW